MPNRHEGTPLTITVPTGKETVRFSLDIAPVLVANCLDCHAQKDGRRADADGFVPRFLAGGQSGNPWKPGNRDDSLIVKKLKGMAGARMPLRKPALDDDVIAKFETWIAEGATFDGANPAEALPVLASTSRAKSLSHDDLSADRRDQAQLKLRLADPSEKPLTARNEEFSFDWQCQSGGAG